MEMEDLQHRCLKYGDTVYLKVDGRTGFVSGIDKLSPQVRVDELKDEPGLDQPPELTDCVFQLTQKFQYTQKVGVLAELARQGLSEDLLLEEGKGGDGFT